MIILKQKVSNREMALHGEAVIRQIVLGVFMRHLVDVILPKLELEEEVCEVVSQVDYNLSPFRFSQQFGTEYSARLVIMTPAELEEHDRQLCQSCSFDQVLHEDYGDCASC